MNLVVADTTPLRYLIEIDEIGILGRLFERVLVPDEVMAELRNSSAPSAVRLWASHPPSWLATLSAPEPVEDAIRALDAGERAAISLAISSRINLLAIDERRGTSVARRQGLETVGTLGLLGSAALRDFVDFDVAVDRLLRTSFRCEADLILLLRRRFGKRNQ